MEVKTVVDTDYNPALREAVVEAVTEAAVAEKTVTEAATPLASPSTESHEDDEVALTKPKAKRTAKAKKFVFYGRPERTGGAYSRAAIFPWGKSAQKGPDGEKVVSARAIKHVRELTAISSGERTEEGGERLSAAVLFVVVRG